MQCEGVTWPWGSQICQSQPQSRNVADNKQKCARKAFSMPRVNECERRARKESKSNRSITNLSVCANNIMSRKSKKNKNALGGGGTSDSALQRNMRRVGKQSRGRGAVAPRRGSKDLWAVSNTNQASLRQHSSQEQRQQLGCGQQPGSRAANYPKAATATESLNCPARPA